MTLQQPDDPDLELLARYRAASRSEAAVPSDAARRAILAEGQRIAALNAAATTAPRRSNWKYALIGSLSAAALAAFLVIPRFVSVPTQIPIPTQAQAPAPIPVPVPAEKSAPVLAAPRHESPRRVAAEAPAAANAESRMTADSMKMSAGSAMFAKRAVNRNEIMQAVTSGDVARIRALLDAGAPVDLADEKGRSLLLLATEQGNTDAVRALLSHGADPMAADAAGNTPLTTARRLNFATIESLLTQAEAARAKIGR